MLIMGCAMFVVGCGAVPEVLLDVAKNSAKEAIVEKIDDAVHEFVGDLLDLENLPPLLDSDAQAWRIDRK